MQKAKTKKTNPDTKQRQKYTIFRTLGFGLMLIAWWIVTIELPGRNLFMVIAQNWIERSYYPITIWAYGFTQKLIALRPAGGVVIALLIALHIFLWKRYPDYDIYGRWLFRTFFFLLYILLYGVFFAVFIGAELPIWINPLNDQVPPGTL